MDSCSKCPVYRNLSEYLRMLSNMLTHHMSIPPACAIHEMLFAVEKNSEHLAVN